MERASVVGSPAKSMDRRSTVRVVFRPNYW